MNSELYDDTMMERQIKARFGLSVDVKSMIARRLPVGAAAFANVFLSGKGILYCLIVANGKMNLGDAKKILTRMKLKPELWLPPRGEANYFNIIGEQKFREVFPGRSVVQPSDLTFYKTLAPYNPALAQISWVDGGVIRQFDSDAVGHWRPAVKFAYRRIKAL
ncbi:MAG: hypothetical protein LBM73_00925 [Candidatus Nomurabacteria bacterium]|jgi:hypothetical protein|nr:hypothetical protein [Candidatus Nomurabacteria bacterium]